MLSESHPLIRRVLRFIALPYCFFKLVNWDECKKSRFHVVMELLYIFFKLKYFPDNYSPCRFYEKDRSSWAYYYGSTYNSYPRAKLRKAVQKYDYQIIFNDKSVSEQLCKGMDVRLPQYYGEIDIGGDYRKSIENIFKKHHPERIIIKSLQGHAGRGIDLATNNNGNITVMCNSLETNLSDYKLQGKSIVQEFIEQHDTISTMSTLSVNTVRLVTMWTSSNEIIVLSALMRFGVGDAYIDNWSAGGVAVGVDHVQGELMAIAYDKYGNEYYKHPDSGVTFKSFKIPYWNDVIYTAKEVQKSCPFYKMIGVDVAIAKDGPILIEINANPDIVMQEQTAGPLLKNNRNLIEFNDYDLLINKQQKNLLKNI